MTNFIAIREQSLAIGGTGGESEGFDFLGAHLGTAKTFWARIYGRVTILGAFGRCARFRY